MDALGWTPGKAPQRLTAEIVGDGRLRFRDSGLVRPHIAEIAEDLSAYTEEDEEARHEEVQALRDRYRDVTLRPSDGRVQLNLELHAVLDPKVKLKSPAPMNIYVELGRGYLDVFSLRGRLRRLAKLRGATEIPS